MLMKLLLWLFPRTIKRIILAELDDRQKYINIATHEAQAQSINTKTGARYGISGVPIKTSAESKPSWKLEKGDTIGFA